MSGTTAWLYGACSSVIGRGYVRLPLAIKFGKRFPIIGRGIKRDRIDQHKRPDLTLLNSESEAPGHAFKPRDIVICESTVSPGAMDEDGVPVLEKVSGLKFNRDFPCGYSLERIYAGDEQQRLTAIPKATSGSIPVVADKANALYASIVTAGTCKAESIRVAKAAKAADKKWNFLRFPPGLVGGHCIGVAPYYLTHKTEAIGHHPQVILAGRRINDGMGADVAWQLVKAMLKKRIQVNGARVLIREVTFKENCPDLRKTRIVDVIEEFHDYGLEVDVYDPWTSSLEALHE